jgi:hypothetical protein
MLDRAPLHSPDEGLSQTARQLLVDALREELGVDAKEIMRCFLRVEGFIHIYELDAKLRSAGRAWLPRVEESGPGGKLAQAAVAVALVSRWNDAEVQLLNLPDLEFLAALEHALSNLDVELYGRSAEEAFSAARDRIAQLFRARLLPYGINENGIITWNGEPALHELAIAPALAALADPRLATAHAEFEHARRELCLGELDDAANDAGCAVESTMAVLLDAHKRRQPSKFGKERVQAGPLFDALETAGILDRERDRHLVFGAIDVRDAGSHGAGVKLRQSNRAYVEAGIASAAAAITYLASKLPA